MGSILYFYYTGAPGLAISVMGTGSVINVLLASSNTTYLPDFNNPYLPVYGVNLPGPGYITNSYTWTLRLLANYYDPVIPLTYSSLTAINSGTLIFGNTYLTQIISNGSTMGLNNLDNAFWECTSLNTVPTNFGTGNDNITSMVQTFCAASSFNQNISGWNFEYVTNMQGMFQNASAFNNGGVSLNTWDVSHVQNFSYMFNNATAFNNGAAQWSTSNPLSWNLGTITTMTSMFQNATSFNSDISSWNLSGLNGPLDNMFNNAPYFTSDLSSWEVGGCTSMANMFNNARNFTSDLSSWSITGNCTSMVGMFVNASSFNSNLGNWNVSQTNMQSMFVDTRYSNDYPSILVPDLESFNSMTIENYDATLQGWANQSWTTSASLFTTNCLIYSNQSARNTLTGKGMIIAGDVYIPANTDIYNPFSLTYNYQDGTATTPYQIPSNYNTWVVYFDGEAYTQTISINQERTTVTFTMTNGIPPLDFPINIVIVCTDQSTVPYYFLGNLQGEVVCFNEGTKILYMNKKMEDEYIRIELLRPGDFVKTFKHGYRKIDMIGKNVFINTPTIFKKCMYKMEKTDTNGLFEDLIVTGGHSILVDEISEEERVLNEQLFWGPTPKLDNKYLLLSSVSKQFKPMKNNKKYTYYHLVLDNEDVNEERYGIWANGILTETPSKDFFKKQRFMLL